jgi:antitoxin component YwqK of YwqJK toxin-antitoxin module
MAVATGAILPIIGKLLQKGKFKLNWAEGNWNVYDENSKLIEIQNFKAGELI